MTQNGTATKTCEIKLSRLTVHPRNPRTISPARLEQLQRTITAERDMLQARPVIALKDGTVIAGNQRLEVYDPFVGTGTTIIAAEMLGRSCFAMELEPRYCDVVRDRYEAFVAK